MNTALKYDLVQAMAAPISAKDIKPKAVSECLFCTKTYTGKITDEKAEPLSGATLVNQRSKIGTFTNEKGNFNLKALPSDLIEVRFMGMHPQMFLAKNLPPLLKMQEEEIALEEVVVTHTLPKKEDKHKVQPSYNSAVKKSKKWLWIAGLIIVSGIVYGVVKSDKNKGKTKKVEI